MELKLQIAATRESELLDTVKDLNSLVVDLNSKNMNQETELSGLRESYEKMSPVK